MALLTDQLSVTSFQHAVLEDGVSYKPRYLEVDDFDAAREVSKQHPVNLAGVSEQLKSATRTQTVISR
jgi:hypothetical protein